jgi:hypothetical protein
MGSPEIGLFPQSIVRFDVVNQKPYLIASIRSYYLHVMVLCYPVFSTLSPVVNFAIISGYFRKAIYPFPVI